MNMNRTRRAAMRFCAAIIAVGVAFFAIGCSNGDDTVQYDVRIAADIQNGALVVSHTLAAAGTVVTISAVPDSGYQLTAGSLTVTQAGGDTVSVNAAGAFTMPAANVTVSGEFEPLPGLYTVSIQAGIQNGVITASPALAAEGTTITLTVTPDSGFQLKTGTLGVKQANGSAVPLTAADTFIMPAANVTVSGEFEVAQAMYQVTIRSGIQNGTITAYPTLAAEGTTVTLTITPDDDYALKADSLSVTQTNGGAVELSAVHTFAMPAADVTVDGEFEAVIVTYAITIQEVTGGTISAGVARAAAGDSITLTIIPDSGYELKAGSLSVKRADETSVTVSGSHTFTMPAANVTVSGIFELKPDTLAVHFEGVGDETINLSDTSANYLYRNQYQSFSITVHGDYDCYWWYYNGQPMDWGQTLSVYSVEEWWNYFYEIGLHTIAVVVQKGDAYYSKEVTFRVVE